MPETIRCIYLDTNHRWLRHVPMKNDGQSWLPSSFPQCELPV